MVKRERRQFSDRWIELTLDTDHPEAIYHLLYCDHYGPWADPKEEMACRLWMAEFIELDLNTGIGRWDSDSRPFVMRHPLTGQIARINNDLDVTITDSN